MNGVKKLRVQTPKAEELQQHIYEGPAVGDDVGISWGNDCDYTIHYNAVDARRDVEFLPDYSNPVGYEEFDLFSFEKPLV